MDWKFWLALIPAVIQAVFVTLEYFGVKPKSMGAEDTKQSTVKIMALLMLLTWGAVAYDLYDRRYGRSIVEPYSQILGQWGNDGKTSCWGTVRTITILGFSGQYKVALICGLNDPTIDMLDEKRISVSAFFRIVPDQVPIVLPMREEMTKAIVDHTTSTIWYMPILMPEGVDTAVIHQMSDVEQYGGKLLNPQYSKRGK